MATSTSSTATKKAAATKGKKAAKPEKAATAPVEDSTVTVNTSAPAEGSSSVVATTEAAAVLSVDGLIATINAHFQTAEKELRAGKALVKKLHQLHNKEIKQAAVALKAGRRRRERDPNAPKRAPSGIAKPSKISPELAGFLKVDPTAELARTDVIRQIAGYIKTNNLENPSNRREIIPDKDLSSLLGIEKGHKDKITYFNLQRYMKPHFPKAVAAS